MSLPQDGYKYELFNGGIVVSPAGFNHGEICAAIVVALGSFARQHSLGKVCDGQTGFRLVKGVKRKTVLAPDVSFMSSARVLAMKDRDRFFDGAPDLAVEVMSRGDSLARTERKVRLYLRNGARLAWVIDPAVRQIDIHRPGRKVVTRSAHQWIAGAEVVPGFRIRLRDLLTRQES